MENVVCANKPTDLLGKVSEFQTSYDVFRFLKTILADYGFSNFIVSRLPAQVDHALGSLVILNNWDSDLLKKYDTLSFPSGNPLYSKIRDTTRPYVWNVDVVNDAVENKSKELESLFLEHGLTHNVFIPLHDASSQRYFIAFSGECSPLSASALQELHMIAIYLFDQLCVILQNDNRNVPKLTQREKECLMWTAAGKTSNDIAQILTLSEHTINHYLASVCQKMDAVNRTQAVAKALRIGILQ